METTKKDFELFKKEFTKWQVKFELSHFRIEFIHEYVEGARAQITSSPCNSTGVVRLSTDWKEDEVDKNKILDSSKHEAIHLLFSKFSVQAKDKDYTSSDLDDTEEEIVRKLGFII